MFMYNNTYAVYRKSDGAVAVLTNAQFQGNPPAMLDGSKFGNLLSEVEFVLMYAVAKTDHSIQQGLKFHHNDVILILAECRDTYVGITARKRVGIFPSKLVHIITQRRMCIFNGMVLRMTPNSKVKSEDDYGINQHYDTTVYEITKSPNGLFSWVTHDGYEVSLHVLTEKALTAENTNDDHFYEAIHEVSYCGTTLQEKKRMPLPQPGEGKDSASQGDSSLEGEIWFHGDLSREEAEKVLKEDGDFLVRFMSNFPWVYVLSCKTETGYEHFRLRLNKRSYYHTNGGDFRSIRNLIYVHQNEGQPVSKDPSTVIRRAVPNTTYQAPPLDEIYEDYNPDCGDKDDYEPIGETREDELDLIKDHSVKSLITVFSNETSKSVAGSDAPFRSPPNEEKKSGDETLSTDTRGNSADGLHEKSENEFSSSSTGNEPKYILEMQTIKEEIGSLKSLLQSFLKMGAHSENVKQSKAPSKSENLSEFTDNTDEEVEVTNKPRPEKELPKSKLSDDSREQITPERASYDMTRRNEGETTAHSEEMRKLKEEMNFLRSRLELLAFQNVDVQPQILETYLPCKENEQSVGGNTKEPAAASQQEESYIENVVEYDEENPNQKDLFPEVESIQRRMHLKQELQFHWQMEITDQLRDIVAMYLEPEFFHEVGKKLGVHKNRRTQIENERTDIVERTYELLGQWHQKQGHMATIGKLIESLEPFNPEDFNAILEDFYDEVEDNYSKFT
ncbi:SHC-transforming protein-like 1 [Holothuria leucospilota]|uniref:SHC-transforming protein-like 1 n=1 Tax=Holothuria leucospilota TaxID=206669 RepID=A0A9Q1BN64_HOLLE|nr:SHC-transforming protein-like 1 [Holothuria leucospilota]